MSFYGSRSTVTTVWLLPDDEALAGLRIAEALPAARWLCSQPGPAGERPTHAHPSAPEALECGGGVQTLIPLPAGATAPGTGPGPVPAAVVQLLCSRRVRPGGEEQEEVFAAGRLAVRWYEPEVGPAVHALLTAETRLIWRALRAATRPAKVADRHGRQVSGMRIGAAAHALVSATGLPLDRGGGRFSLVG
ncbi:hypothetical protein ABZ714_00820 [Streptomyces sp. NPDC006798]|uniref:hypothetical protein n=1 Tax=Streptomyces sp. NPDC006798 TaxID=3155462 RepID=UPI003401950E